MTPLEVVAIAARTPVGLTAATTAAAVRAGISRVIEFPFITRQGEPIITAADPRAVEGASGHDRWRPILLGVIDEIRAGLSGLDLRRGGLDVLLALPEVRPGFSAEDWQWVVQTTAAALHERGVLARVVVGGQGHAGAMACMERAAAVAARGEALMLVLGLDGYLDVSTFLWLEELRRLSIPGVANGLVPSEAAGAFVVAPRALQRRLGMPALATVVGVGTAVEARRWDSETGSFGEGATKAVLGAAAGLSLPAEAVDAVVCDINGERYRSEEWGFFATRAHHVMRSLSYQAPSDSWGDVGAAFGALGVVLSVQSFQRGYAPGPRALVMAGSDGGLRGAVIVQAPEGAGGR